MTVRIAEISHPGLGCGPGSLASSLALIALCASATGVSFLSSARVRRAMKRGGSPPVVANTAASRS